MKYKNIKRAIFIERHNRFIASVEVDGKIELAHVKNTGRCKELFINGAEVYIQQANSETRKTRWSIIGVKKGEHLINIDSQVPNKVVKEALENGVLELDRHIGQIKVIKPEYTYGNSRFDLYFETESERGLIEVKGVTLEEEKIAKFPDAPTQRGTKHVNELIKASSSGYLTYVLFLIQMKGIKWFEPNWVMDRVFSEALKTASEKGVKIIAVDSYVYEDCIEIGEIVPIKLG